VEAHNLQQYVLVGIGRHAYLCGSIMISLQ